MNTSSLFVLQFFGFEHLPEAMQAVSRPFGELAAALAEDLPDNPEKTLALRRLLEAKDCAVRCELAGTYPPPPAIPPQEGVPLEGRGFADPGPDTGSQG